MIAGFHYLFSFQEFLQVFAVSFIFKIFWHVFVLSVTSFSIVVIFMVGPGEDDELRHGLVVILRKCRSHWSKENCSNKNLPSFLWALNTVYTVSYHRITFQHVLVISQFWIYQRDIFHFSFFQRQGHGWSSLVQVKLVLQQYTDSIHIFLLWD